MHKNQGDRLKTLRTKHNYTLKHVGKQLNLDPSTISKYENNKRKIDTDSLKRFADFYNVDIKSLIPNTTQPLENPKIYHIKTPLIIGYTKETITLITSFFIGLAIYTLYPADLLLIMVVFFGIAICTRSFLQLFIARERPRHTIKIFKQETLTIEHPYDEGTIRSNLRLDNYAMVWLTIFLFFIVGFYLTEIKSTTDAFILIGLLLANYALYITLIILNIARKTDQKQLPYDATNKLLNTTKYRLFHIITTLTSITAFFFHTRLEQPRTIYILTYICIIIYTLISQGFVFKKMLFYKQYRLIKNR